MTERRKKHSLRKITKVGKWKKKKGKRSITSNNRDLSLFYGRRERGMGGIRGLGLNGKSSGGRY